MATEVVSNSPPSEIQQFFCGKTIFITGATGFVGRLLVEKLLRTCSNLKHIYILLRPKKGKLPEERLKDIVDVPAFDILKTEQPNFLSKISILEGDLSQPYLGLSKTSLNIIKEQVDCVYGIGATVRFDESIKIAAYINVRSTRDLLGIAAEMKQLKSFVYMSTAYSNCVRNDIDETYYEPVITGDNLLDLVECLDEKTLESITPTLLQKYPNTYVFSKSVSEDVVSKESKNLPVVVVRPSIVISSYKEPIPGWIDNLYGPTTIAIGVSMGVIRSLYGNGENISDLVPVDLVVNATIAASWDVAQNKNKLKSDGTSDKNISTPKIYNYVSGSQNPMTWNEYKNWSWEAGLKIPSTLLIWYCTFNFRPNYYHNLLITFLFQTIPAYIIDFFAALIGKETTFVKIVKKLDKFCDVISYFTKRQWNFKNTNVQELWKSLNATDKKLFNFDITSMPWRNYFPTYVLGGRIYLLKDPIETLEAGKKKFIAVRIGHYILVTAFFLILFKLMMMIWHLL